MQLKPNTQHVNIHHKITDILDDHDLAQCVQEPTRGTNLDLILTNYQESFRITEVIPGISDHDIAYTEINKIPAKIRLLSRDPTLQKGKMGKC